jgi:hypothetical protein
MNNVNKAQFQKSDSEFHNKSSETQNHLRRLYEISHEMYGSYGVNWTNHILSTMPIGSINRLFFFNEIYKKIIDIPGVICEFGVQWGAGLAILMNLRNLYEPHNISRKIFGFDTFQGFTALDKKDGPLVQMGDYKTIDNYRQMLDEILTIHESFTPKPHIKKFALIEGDASKTIDQWLDENPYAILSLCIFDMDVYQPTKDVLIKILPRLTRGSVLVFDELNCDVLPGETLAVQEVLGLNQLKLRKTEFQPFSSYAIFGD